ncbi:MAG: hypothetical protein Q9203_006871 [Teloschistes exilis]
MMALLSLSYGLPSIGLGQFSDQTLKSFTSQQMRMNRYVDLVFVLAEDPLATNISPPTLSLQTIPNTHQRALLPAHNGLYTTQNPAKANLPSLNYFDLAIILDVRRDTNVKMGHLDALEWLKQANRAFHDTSPQILRCEMHDYTYSDTNIKVHINIRFDSQRSYENFTYQGVSLDKWILDMESTTEWWTIDLYQRGINLLAGFDRGGSGRSLMAPADEPKVKPNVRTNSSAIRHESSKKKESAEASSSAGPSQSNAGSSKIKEESVVSGSIPLRRKNNPRLDPIAEEGEEIEMEEMLEVRWGKLPEP